MLGYARLGQSSRDRAVGALTQPTALIPILAFAVLAGPVIVGLLFVLLPAFGYLPALGGTAFSLDPWRQLFAAPGLARSATVSLASGLITGAVSLAITGLFLAAFHDSRAFNAIRRLVSPLLAVPHAAAALGLSFLIAPSGLIFRTLTTIGLGTDRPPDLLIVHDTWGLAMMAGLIVKEVPFLLLMSLASLGQIEAANRVAVARTLGYGPVTSWLKTVAPALYPLIRLPLLAVIAYSSSVVDVAIILGPTNPPPLSVAVLRWLNDPDLSARFMASAGAVLQVAVTLAALGLWLLAERVLARLLRPWMEGGRRAVAERPLATLGGFGMGLVAAAALLSLFCLTAWSFAASWRFPALTPTALTPGNWMRAVTTLWGPLTETLLIGALSTACSFAIVIASLEHELRSNHPAGAWAMRLLYLPLVVPPVAFLFGLTVGAQSARLTPGPIPVALGHVVFVLPYIYLSLSEPYRSLDPRWSQMARTLGASEARAFLIVRLPMLLAPCLTALAVGFSVSVGQYLVTQLLGAGRVATLTTEAVALASGGENRVIAVWALAQTVLPALAFALAIAIPRLVWRNRRSMLGPR